MTRVSLTEDYDDRSVISKLNEMDKRVKENASVVTSAEASARQSAQSAQETADRFAGSVGAVVQNANAQINASKVLVDQAKAEVDETVTTVAQAVQTANNASASAQQSATTVAGYETRLSSAENTIQGQGTEIQHLGIETRDLYDRDANNVKLDRNQTITGQKILTNNYPIIFKNGKIGDINPPENIWENHLIAQSLSGRDIFRLYNFASPDGVRNVQFDALCTIDGENKETYLGLSASGGYSYIPNLPTNAPSNAITIKEYVEATDGVTNNLVHRTADETINGIKTFETVGLKNTGAQCHNLVVISGNDRYWVVNLTNPNNTILAQLQMVNYANGTVGIDLSKVNTATGVTETRNIVRF